MSEPTPPTVEQLQKEIADLKAAIASGLPASEVKKLRAELAEAQSELATLKKKPEADSKSASPSPGPLDGLADLENLF